MTDFPISRLSEAETAKALELSRLADVATLPTTLKLLPLLPKELSYFWVWQIESRKLADFHYISFTTSDSVLMRISYGLRWHIPALTFSMLFETLCNYFPIGTQAGVLSPLQYPTSNRAEKLGLWLLDNLE